MADYINKFRFYLFELSANDLNSFKGVGLNTLTVLFLDFFYTFNRKRIMFGTIGQRIPHKVAENILLYQKSPALCHLNNFSIFREMLECIQIGIQFIIEAAF